MKQPTSLQTIQRHHPDDGDEIGKWARQFISVGRPTETGKLLMTLCYAIHESFRYSRRVESGTQPPLMTLQLRQDLPRFRVVRDGSSSLGWLCCALCHRLCLCAKS